MKNSDLGDSQHKQAVSSLLIREINEILRIRPATGSYSSAIKVNGVSLTCRFSQSVGTGREFKIREYQKKFAQEPPDWVINLHPTHTSWVCELAVDIDEPLPEFILISAKRYGETACGR